MQSDHVCVRRVRALTSAVATHRDETDIGPFLAPPLDFLPLRGGGGSEDCGIRSVSDRVSCQTPPNGSLIAQRVSSGANSADPRSGTSIASSRWQSIGVATSQASRCGSREASSSIIVEAGPRQSTWSSGHGREPVGGHARSAQKRGYQYPNRRVLGRDSEVERPMSSPAASQPRDGLPGAGG